MRESPIKDLWRIMQDNKNLKQKFFQFLFIFLIISVVTFMIWMFFWMQTESKECIDDPLKFYAKHMEVECDLKKMHFDISCTPNIIYTGEPIEYDLNFSWLEDTISQDGGL